MNKDFRCSRYTAFRRSIEGIRVSPIRKEGTRSDASGRFSSKNQRKVVIRDMKKIRYVLFTFLFALAGLLVLGKELKAEAATPKEQLSVLNKKQKASLKDKITELIKTGDEKAGSDFSLVFITDDNIPEIDFTSYYYNPETYTGHWYGGIIYFKGNRAEIYSTYSEWYEYDYC